MGAALAKRVREFSRLGAIFGLSYMVFSLILLLLGMPHKHAHVMAFGGLILLPHSIALSYIAGSSRSLPLKILYYSSIISLLLIITPILSLFNIFLINFYIIIIVFSITSIASFSTARLHKGNTRISYIMIGATYILSIISIFLIIKNTKYYKFSETALILSLFYPVPLIYSVTANSFPSTFKDTIRAEPAYSTLFVLALSLIPCYFKRWDLTLILFSISLLLYLFSTNIILFKKYLNKIEKMSSKSIVARRALEYFTLGHAFVIIISLILILLNILYLYGICNILCILHGILLGFVTIHFLIHGPLMIPVILGIKHKKNYTFLPYLLLLASTIAWPINGGVSYALYTLSLIAAAKIVI